MIGLLLMLAAQDGYHRIALAALEATTHTHACVTAPVTYVRHQADGDWHITLDDGTTRAVAEIIAAIPLPRPRKGDVVEVCGITRYDKKHKWPELHPVTRITIVRAR